MKLPANDRADTRTTTDFRCRTATLWVAGLALAVFSLFLCVDASADSGVPFGMQALLVSRLGTFDRNFKARARPVAKVLVLHRGGNSDSAFEGASLARALAELHEIGGVPANVEEAEYRDADALANRCRTDRLAVIYLTVGLESETARIANALTGVDVLTVGTTARHAENGAVVGFVLDEARPKIVLNLTRARAQNVDFKAEVLKLSRIVE
ncbi:MAG: YfiR family protein [Myxococcota bacterium]|nr:YfiR family protein [Myxococcota bacterium]